jgi:hypothetical protein
MVTQSDKQFNAMLLFFGNCSNTSLVQGNTLFGRQAEPACPDARGGRHFPKNLQARRKVGEATKAIK